ncbi:ferredoxin reductase [Jidongwangia harbinensis]|uniref:ferredoxin reductase n=1 Tax=Jidongwangia harbinensis TaxID=2878561 RepID=UPI001CD95812|nr:ferredoxin reductase [Jidongwangia harbinensis]MCA2215935.1 ferredoxin reductase [Jidongwangia harbinensis]
MARAAVSGRLTWRVATVAGTRWETPTARTLVLDVPDWPGHLPGQHVDVRLTAPDGYRAQRSYSIASAWTGDGPVELTVQRLDDGEVSPYLTDEVTDGDQLELRGPVGGWFVWRPEQTAPVLLVAGGSGLVPLMAMIRARGAVRGRQPFRLICSVRTPRDLLYADELARRVRDDPGLDVRYVYTRQTPDGWPEPAKRISVATLNSHGWPPDFGPDCFVCGPTSFVETAADILVALGHDPRKIRTERFGGTA